MKRHLFAVAMLLAGSAFAQQRAPEIPFTSVPDYPKLPAGMNFGEVPGVAVNSRGHVFVFSRSNSANGPAFGAAAAQLFEFDPNGEVRPRDRQGSLRLVGRAQRAHRRNDNIWAIDKGSDMIVRFNPQGRVVWVFGAETGGGRRRRAAGASRSAAAAGGRHLPSADRRRVGLAGQHLHHRRLRQLARRQVRQERRLGEVMGIEGHRPGPVRHAARDRHRPQDNIYVGDRTNQRIQVFDTDGKFLRMFTIDVPPDPTSRAVNGPTPTGERLKQAIGAPNSLCITPGPTQVLFVGESTYPGRIFKVALDGKVLGVIGRSGRNLKQFSGAHALACPSERELYVGETSNWRVQKLLLR